VADQEIVDLLTLGPFAGFDTRTAGPYAAAGTSTVAQNTNTNRIGGALCTAHGRLPFIQFSNLASPISKVTTLTVSASQILYIAQDTQGNIAYWDSAALQFGTLGQLPGFTQAVQSNGALWLNNGYQIYYGPNNAPMVAQWNYPSPQEHIYNYHVELAAPGSGTLMEAWYSYAFVLKIAIPNASTNQYFQYTTPNGDLATGTRDDGSAIFPFSVHNTSGGQANRITGIFAGTTPDGYVFSTEIFRYSTNSPTWQLLVTLTTNQVYLDNATDASISGNQQIIAFQDQPPTGSPAQAIASFPYPLDPIEAHQDRMWTMAIVNDKNTNNTPQTQVWYSQVGEPWSFDSVNQTLLIEDNETTIEEGNLGGPNGVPFGDVPVQLCALGSSLMVYRRQTTSLVYGVDESTYQPLKIFADLGCISPRSVVKANGLIWWLSAQGVYSFDGSNVQWISKQIYNALQSYGPAALNTAIGAYKDLTYYLILPDAIYTTPTQAQITGITWKYYIPDQTWSLLPYATSSAVFATSLPSDLTPTPLSMNQICAVRPNTFWLDFWVAADTDLTLPITAVFKSQQVDSQSPQTRKTYKCVMIEAPLQPGVTAELSLFVDGNLVQTWPGEGGTPIDLSKSPTTHIFNVTGSVNGYLAQLQVTLTNAENATGPAIVYSAKVGGQPMQAWVVYGQNG
jgi:hypothetical protein